MAGRVWTHKEDDIIRSEYQPGKAKQLARRLHRSDTAVVRRASKLGVSNPEIGPDVLGRILERQRKLREGRE